MKCCMYIFLHIPHFNHLLYRWSCDGLLSVYREDMHNFDDEPFISYKDRNPFVINYIGFSTAWGATGEWIIEGNTLIRSCIFQIDKS